MIEYPSYIFAEILLPLPFHEVFTYRIPLELVDRVKPGFRVVVQFGVRRVFTGVVLHVVNKVPEGVTAKYILEVLDDDVVYNEKQIKLLEKVSSYYLSSRGETLQASLPAGLKLSSVSMISLRQDVDLEGEQFTERESILLKHLQLRDMSYDECAETLLLKHIVPVLKGLLAKSAIQVYEQVNDKYKPSTIKKVFFDKSVQDAQGLDILLTELNSAPDRQDVVVWMMQQLRTQWSKGILKSDFKLHGLKASAIKSLLKDGILLEKEEEVSRVSTYVGAIKDLPILSEAQQMAYQQIKTGWDQHPVVLLQGITGSGKTEIYMHAISESLKSGMQVLLLLPEIALTEQITGRLQERFGNGMAVYHSRFTDNERVEVYKGLLDGTFDLVVGVRSAVFLPFSRLGLIIVDEEHDTSYKQQDPAPRYHGRDTALMLAQIHGCKTLLGSATPSLETWHLCKQQQWSRVLLAERYNQRPLPEITLSSLKQESRQATMQFEFGKLLLDEMHESLERKEQVILFHNRRGYAHWIACMQCNHIPTCENCAVSLTYHQHIKMLKCHLCGYKTRVPEACPTCAAQEFKTIGFGTEQLDEHLEVLFPMAKIKRMDQDTTRGKHAVKNLLTALKQREIDILLGTQMVTKGLDAGFVTLVGIIHSDRLLFFPDFRAQERTFQILTQVCGRAGRADRPGKVIIQTYDPSHTVYQAVKNNELEEFYTHQIKDRQLFHYPPFYRLIKITIKHPSKDIAEQSAQLFANTIRRLMQSNMILGPEEPHISKIRNKYLRDILIKIPRDFKGLQSLKIRLRDEAAKLKFQKGFGSVQIVFDVDPV